MTEPIWHKAVLLGAGDLRPRLDVLHPNGDQATLIDLSPGQSVYAVDRCPGSAALASGTRSGEVIVLMNPWPAGGDENAAPPINLIQGSPVLSVCWWDEQHLAVSDLAGRVLLWDLRNQAYPQLLNNDKEVICALCRVSGGMLAGLTVGGTLLGWRLGDMNPVFQLSSTAPACKLALVNLAYHPLSGAVYYPGRQGRLISLQVKGGDRRDLSAHEGDFYAFSVGDKQIVTAGLFDRTVKIWQGQEGHMVAEHALPWGVISLARFPGHSQLVAAVTEDGRAVIIDLDDGAYQPRQDQGSGPYRSAFPAVSADQSLAIRMDMAKSLASQLELALSQGDSSVAADLHERLTELGYEHVALAMRSAWEVGQGDYLAALGCSTVLLDMLPNHEPRALESLQRHAQLLTRYWMWEEAFELYVQMQTIDSSVTNPLSDYEPVVRKDKGLEIVIDSDIALEEIIEANNILKNIFSGTFILFRQEEYRCRSISMSPGDIAQRFNLEFGESSPEPVIRAQAIDVGIVARSGFRADKLVRIVPGDGSPSPVSFGLLINGTVSHTSVTPLVLFTWQGNGEYRQANQQALACLHKLKSQAGESGHLDLSYRMAMDFIRRLATEAQTVVVKPA